VRSCVILDQILKKFCFIHHLIFMEFRFCVELL
jgi:hypothetical protein